MKHMKFNKRLFFLVLLLPAILVGCLKDEDKTLILFGEEGYVKDFTEVFGTDSVVSTEGTPIAVGGVIPVLEGINPPDVRGEFRFTPIAEVFPENDTLADTIYFRFGGDYDQWTDYLHGQNHMIVHCDIKIPGLALNSALFHSELAYVKGSGNGFTVYLERKQEVSNSLGSVDVRYKVCQGIAISGERLLGSADAPGGIRNCHIALYNKQVEVTNKSQLLTVMSVEQANAYVNSIEEQQGKLTVYKDALCETNTSEVPFINWNE